MAAIRTSVTTRPDSHYATQYVPSDICGSFSPPPSPQALGEHWCLGEPGSQASGEDFRGNRLSLRVYYVLLRTYVVGILQRAEYLEVHSREYTSVDAFSACFLPLQASPPKMYCVLK